MNFSDNLLIYFYFAVFIIGCSFGSFLNLLASRIILILQQPEKINRFEPPNWFNHAVFQNSFWIKILLSNSKCLNCYQQIKCAHNIPIVSYFYLKSKCANCNQKISITHPLVELVFGILALVMFFIVQNHWLYLSKILLVYLFSFLLFLIAWIDFKTQKIPNDLNFLLLWFGILTHAIFQFIPLTEVIFSIIICYFSLNLIHFLFQLIRKKQGMGDGDIYLLSAISAWFGIDVISIIIYSSFSAIIVFTLLAWFKNYNSSSKIPFSPFIAIGCIIFLFEQLIYVN